MQDNTGLTLVAFEAGMPIIGVLVGQGIGNVLGQFAGYMAAVVIELAGLIALMLGDRDDNEQHRLRLLAHAAAWRSSILASVSASMDSP